MRRRIEPVCNPGIDESAGHAYGWDRDRAYCSCGARTKDKNPDEMTTDGAEPCSAKAEKLVFPISGMNGAGCAVRIEKRLAEIQGAWRVRANFGAQKATIYYDFSKLDCSKIVRAVRELGYGVRTQKVILPVQGTSNADAIKKAVRRVPGVVAANVNCVTGKAAVEYILGCVCIACLADAASRMGDLHHKQYIRRMANENPPKAFLGNRQMD